MTLAMFDSAAFAKAVAGRLKHQRLEVRAAAQQTGLSAATISRVSRGSPPDVQSLATLLAWLQLPFEVFVSETDKYDPPQTARAGGEGEGVPAA